mgnify:CR=1 FL=1
MTPRVYVDTSAYLCVLFGEDGAAAIAERLAGAQLYSSVLLVLESRRNIVRLARNGQLPAKKVNDLLERVRKDAELFTLRDLTLELCADPLVPALTTPRSLDLAHLRTAAWFHRRDPLHDFVTRDDNQEQAARELGLPARQP